MEKADILEMAVKHLQNVQRQQLALGMAGDPTVLRKFKTGFEECSREVSTYISRVGEHDATPGLRGRVDSHLTKCMHGIEQIAMLNFPSLAVSSLNEFLRNDVRMYEPSMERQGYERKDNCQIRQHQGTIQLIPSRLPTGELAFLLPNSRTVLNSPSIPTSSEKDLRRRSSAFATVKPAKFPSKSPPSPPLSPNTSKLLNINNNNVRNDGVDIGASERMDRTSSSLPTNDSNRPDVIEGYFRNVDSDLQKSYQQAFASSARLGYCESDNVDGHNLENMDKNISVVEPLRIITNHSERFKRAQVPRETVDCEENRRHFKRHLDDSYEAAETVTNNGLVSVVPLAKIAKTSSSACLTKQYGEAYSDSNSDNANNRKNDEGDQKSTQPCSSRSGEDMDHNNDMWRPW